MGNLAPQLEEVSAQPQLPHVFVRTFTVPSGMPWDQDRAAQLEVRHGAPLPIGELMHRLKRIGGWGPGRTGQFAVFYIRRKDYAVPFETTVDVDGQDMRVAFGVAGDQLKRARGLALIVLASGASIFLMGWAATIVLSVRLQASDRLEILERQTTGKLRAAGRVQREREQSQELARAQENSGLPSDVIADLTWLAHARSPQARITSVHWDHGLLAVEARGDAPPVSTRERPVVRDNHPVRPGVWLWGISRMAPAAAAPTSATMRDSP